MDAQQKLFRLIKDINDIAYAASWMNRVEHVLWLCVEEGPRDYGRMTIDKNYIKQLGDLSKEADGWFYWDAISEETIFCSLEEWKKKYSKEEALKALEPFPFHLLFTTH